MHTRPRSHTPQVIHTSILGQWFVSLLSPHSANGWQSWKTCIKETERVSEIPRKYQIRHRPIDIPWLKTIMLRKLDSLIVTVSGLLNAHIMIKMRPKLNMARPLILSLQLFIVPPSLSSFTNSFSFFPLNILFNILGSTGSAYNLKNAI